MPVDGGRAHVDVHGVRDPETEPLARPRRRRDAGRRRSSTAPVTTITAQATTPTAADDAQPASAPTEAARPRAVRPGLERDDDRERRDDEREQEVRHHGERVELEDHRQRRRAGSGRPSRGTRPAQSRRTQRGSPTTRRAASQHDERQPRSRPARPSGSRTRRTRGSPASGNGVSTAARPVVAAEPRAGQTHERARRDDELEGDERGERDGAGTASTRPSARPPSSDAARPRLECSPAPQSRRDAGALDSTRPIRQSSRPAAANVASSDRRALRGERDEQPPAVCGS